MAWEWLGNAAVKLGITPSKEHYKASDAIESRVKSGEISAETADYLKGRNLIETGFNPVLATAGALPFQLFDEAFDPEIKGKRSFSNALSQAWHNVRGIGSVVGERLKDNPLGPAGAVASSKTTSNGGLISQGTADKQSGSTFRTDQDQADQEAPERKTVTQTKVSPLRASRQAAGRAQREAKKEFGAGSKEHLKAIEVTQEAGRKLEGRK